MGSQRSSAICPACGFKLISPLWSETVTDDAIANRWRCVICSSSFETVDHVEVAAGWTMDAAERVCVLPC